MDDCSGARESGRETTKFKGTKVGGSEKCEGETAVLYCKSSTKYGMIWADKRGRREEN